MNETATQTEDTRAHPEGGEHGAHPTEAKYYKIALFLAVVTAGEVALYYFDIGAATNPVLMAMAAVKFATVAMFFMHLKFDNRVLRRLFITGLILAVAVYAAALRMFPYFQ